MGWEYFFIENLTSLKVQINLSRKLEKQSKNRTWILEILRWLFI